MTQRITLGDVASLNSIPDPTAEPGVLRFASAGDFANVSEDSAEPLLGTPEDTVLSVAGTFITYGAAGGGKTTLGIDGLVHLAAGADWIGLEVPRKLTVTVIENEGPRGMFRQKLARKLAAWSEQDLAPVYVLEEPWAQFTFDDEQHRQELADHLNATGSDLLVCGPISTLGMTGGGTPDDINTFVGFIAAVRQLVRKPLAVWLVHHENRAGQISGAWERVPDTLVHVTPGGNGHTRIYWQKVRWSSQLHATTTHLSWADDEGFSLEDAPEPATAERIWEDIATFVLANGGCSWNTVDENTSGKAPLKRKTRDRMVADGVLVDRGPGKSFKLWHRDDPEVRPSGDAPRDALWNHPADEWESASASLRPLRSRDAGQGRTFTSASTVADEDDPVLADLNRYREVLARPERPVVGDEDYLPWLFAKLEAGLLTEAEWHQADQANRLVTGRRTA